MADQNQPNLWQQLTGAVSNFLGGGSQPTQQAAPTQQKAPVYVNDFYGSDYAKESPYSSAIISSPSTQVNRQGVPVNQPTPTINAPGGNQNGGASTSKADAWRAQGGQGDVPVGWNGPASSGVDEAAQRAAMEARQRDAINASFDPVFQELDRQLGQLPGQGQELSTQVGQLTDYQKGQAETSRTRGIAQLDESAKIDRDNAKTGLRSLEEDIRNQLQAKSFYFGALGAGDSSAPIMASEAITKAGLKSRGGVINTLNKALNDIELKKGDVTNLATDQLGKIEQYKTEKLSAIGQWVKEQTNALMSEKANAGSERGKAIAQLIQGLDQDFLQRARQLDDEVRGFKNSVSTWQMQRAAELEDYGKKLSMSASYGGTGDNLKTYQAALTDFSNQIKLGVPSQNALNSTISKFGVNPLEGASLTDEQLGGVKAPEDPWANITNLVTSQLQQGR